MAKKAKTPTKLKTNGWEQRFFPVEVSTITKFGLGKPYSIFLSNNSQNEQFMLGSHKLSGGPNDNEPDDLPTLYTQDMRMIKMPNGRKFVQRRTHMDGALALSYGEVLYGNMAEQLDMPYVKYYPVTNSGANAKESRMTVMSEFCYNKKTELLLNIRQLTDHTKDKGKSYSNCLTNVFSVLDELDGKECVVEGKNTTIKIDPKAKLDLFKMYVLDYITMQTDRRYANINFIVNKDTGQLKAAPLLDNGWIPNLLYSDVTKEAVINSHHGGSIPVQKAKLLSKEQLGQLLTIWSRLSLNGDSYKYGMSHTDRVRQNCEDMVAMSATIPEATDFLTTLSEKANITKAIEKTNQQIGFTLPDVERQNVINTADMITGYIAQGLSGKKGNELVERTAIRQNAQKSKMAL